jgi:CII-binding regulator of phage lambda lysogenization HflD
MMADPNVTLRIKVDARDGTATVEGFANKVEDASKRSGRSFSDVAAAAGRVGAAVAAAATVVAAGTAALVRSSINTADQFAKMSQGVGLSVESLSTLTYAAERSGAGLDQLRIGLNTLNRNASAAAAGTGEAKGALEALGITVTDTSGKLKGTDTLLAELADKFSQYEDSSQKAALAQRIFGESGTALIPLLNQGAAGMGELQQRARDLGLEIETTTAKQAEAFNDLMADGSDLVKGFGNDLAAELLPGLVELARVFVDSGIEGRNAASAAETFADGLRFVIGVTISAVAQIQKLGAITGAVAASIGDLGGLIGEQFSALSEFFSDVTALGPVDAYTKLMRTGFTNASNAIEGARLNLDALGDSFDAIDADAEAKIAALNSTLRDTAEAAGEEGGRRGAAPALANVAKQTKQVAKEAKEAKAEVDPFRTAIERLLDQVEGAQIDRLAADMVQLQIALDEAINEGDIERATRLGDALEYLSQQGVEGFGEFRDAGVEAFDTLADEGRALEDALSSAIGDFVSGNIESFDDFADAVEGIFRNLIADLVRQWVQANIFGQGQGGAGGILSNLFGGGQGGGGGGGLGGLFGSPIGGTGSTLGTLLGGAGIGYAVGGNAAGAILGAAGSFLGSAFGPIGTALGSFVGGFIGGLFSDDPKPRIRINSSGAGIGNIGTRGSTALGSLAFNADDLEDTRGTERQLLEAIQALDEGFVQLVNTFGLGEEQMAALRDAAAGWSIDLRNSAITAENVLGSRFGALLATFDDTVQQFVTGAGDIEAQFAALSEVLYVRAAADSGLLIDNFEDLLALLQGLQGEGETLDITFQRVVASTMLLEDALGAAGVSLDIGREAFINLAAGIVEAAGGLQQAADLWSAYFGTFYSEQERAELAVQRATEGAIAELADLGLQLADFTGSQGLADFRALFESVLPDLTADQVVAWLEAARALGILTDATAALAQFATEAATITFNALGGMGRPDGSNNFSPDPGSVLGGGGVTGQGPQGQDFRPLLPVGWVNPDAAGGGGFSGLPDAIDRSVDALNRWIETLDRLQRDLLTDEVLTTLTPEERLAEIERQYNEARQGALANDEASRGIFDGLARQYAEALRQMFGSTDQYSQGFAGILADIGLLRSTAGAPITGSPVVGGTGGSGSGALVGGSREPSAYEVAMIDRIDTLNRRVDGILHNAQRTAQATEETAANTAQQQERTYG